MSDRNVRGEIVARIDVRGIPELVWGLRHEMANILREEADADPNPCVTRRLRDIALAYEAGVKP